MCHERHHQLTTTPWLAASNAHAADGDSSRRGWRTCPGTEGDRSRQCLRASSRDAAKTKDGTVWSLLRQTHDNTTRSFVIRDLARLGVQPDVVIQRLRTESDVSGRRALLLALGAYSDDDISSAQREALERLVVEVSPWRAHFATAIPQEESCAR